MTGGGGDWGCSSEGGDRVPAADVGLGLKRPHGQICRCGSLTLDPNSLLGLFFINNFNSEGILSLALFTLPYQPYLVVSQHCFLSEHNAMDPFCHCERGFGK